MASRKKVYKIGDVIGDYRLTEECGGGGFGQVFLAENTVSGLLVALKILFDTKQGDKELDGLKAFQQCKNEHLIQIHHIGKTDSGLLYYTMDRADDAGTKNKYEADSLGKRIKKGKISPDEVFDLAIHMAEALGSLHEKGLIHRDVKPANIIFVDKKPVLADIGLVTDAERPDVSFAGTKGFLPAYIYAGRHPQCPESDFYALGIVLLCALTGQSDPQKALDCNASMTLSGHSGDLQRLCTTLEDGNDFEGITIHSSEDFLNCLKGEETVSSSSRKNNQTRRTTSKRETKQKTYHELLEELSEEGIFTAPNIPEKKLKNALRSFAPGVEPKNVLLLTDDTVFGSAKEGLIITKDAVYGKEAWEAPKKIQLFRNTTVSVKNSKNLCINNYDFITLTNHKDKYSKLVAIIRAICASHSDSSEKIIKPEILPKQKSGCLKKILIFAAFWIFVGFIGNWLEKEETKKEAAKPLMTVSAEKNRKKTSKQPSSTAVKKSKSSNTAKTLLRQTSATHLQNMKIDVNEIKDFHLAYSGVLESIKFSTQSSGVRAKTGEYSSTIDPYLNVIYKAYEDLYILASKQAYYAICRKQKSWKDNLAPSEDQLLVNFLRTEKQLNEKTTIVCFQYKGMKKANPDFQKEVKIIRELLQKRAALLSQIEKLIQEHPDRFVVVSTPPAVQIKDSRVRELLGYFPEHPQMRRIVQNAKSRPISGVKLSDKDRMAGWVWFYDEEKDELLEKTAKNPQKEVSEDTLRKLAQLLWKRTEMMIYYLVYEKIYTSSPVQFNDAGYAKVVDYIYTLPIDDLRTPENEKHPVLKTIFPLLIRFADNVPSGTEKIINERVETWKKNHNLAPETDINFIIFQKHHAVSLQKIRLFFRKYQNLNLFNESAQQDYYEIGVILNQRNIALKKLRKYIKQE